MHDKLNLNKGETLVKKNHRSEGSRAETDIDTYSIVDDQGKKVGSVEHIDRIAINGFHHSQSVKQWDIEGNLVVSVMW